MNYSQEYEQPSYRFEFLPDEFDAIKACNDEHGFAIVKGLLNEEQVASLKAEVLRVVDPQGVLPPGGNATHSSFVEEAPEFWKLLDYQPYMRLYSHMLGTEQMTIHRSAAIIRKPGNAPMYWHTDFSFSNEPPKTANDVLNRGEWPNGAWFYLNGTHPSRGGLAIIPDSHRPDWPGPEGFTFTENRVSFYREGTEPEQYTGFDVPGMMPVLSDPGDLLFFAPRTYHGVFPHNGDEPRLSCGVAFRPAEVSISAPWPLPESAQRFVDNVPESLKPYVEGYTGIQRTW
jgi:ectoine hydroxylase-related dioxygenase (phytanoyl-CoA dioxygenase family)